jgi:DNA-binding response OmpR family regulator
VASKVLIVDDDDATREALKQVLTHAGYQTTAAGSFQDGVQALMADAPDLLITDVRLGEYNGLQLVATAGPPIPAIVLTGFADPVLQKDATTLGADYLVKPIAPPDLLKLVEKKLAASRR